MVACLGYQPGRQPKTSTLKARSGEYAGAGSAKDRRRETPAVNQGLVLTGSAMNFADFVTNTYIPIYLSLLSSSTQDSYRSHVSKYLEPRFSRLSLRDLTRLTIQHYFSGMADRFPSDNLKGPGHTVFHSPFCGRRGIPDQKSDGRFAITAG